MPRSPLHTVHAASLRDVTRLARELKVDAVAVMQEVGLSPGQLDNPEARVSVTTGLQLLESFAVGAGRKLSHWVK